MALSAGLLLYRRRAGGLEVLLGHPGGPFFRGRDRGVWSVPKGLVEPGEDPLAAARREFSEETGCAPGDVDFLPLGEAVQRGGKRVLVWAFAGDCDPAALRSNTFELEWPRGSGRRQSFPEIDRFELLPLAEARAKIVPAQAVFLDRLHQALAA